MCFSSLCRYGLGDTPITDEVLSEFDHSSQREFGLAFRNSCAYGIECEDDPLDWRSPDWYAPKAAFGHSATYDGLFTEKDFAAEWYQSEAFRWYQKAAAESRCRQGSDHFEALVSQYYTSSNNESW